MLDWDQLAPAYGRQLWLERSAIRSLLDLLDVRSDERLLDLATGPAPVLAQLARRPTRPADAVGIDSSEAMISRASPLPAAWRLQIADATRLPFADHSFDVLTASFLLHVLAPAKRQAVIAESARVLRLGGRLGVVTIAPPRDGSRRPGSRRWWRGAASAATPRSAQARDRPVEPVDRPVRKPERQRDPPPSERRGEAAAEADQQASSGDRPGPDAEAVQALRGRAGRRRDQLAHPRVKHG